ncbi:hypothetical protein [Paraburkholderia sp. BCC1885]|jgi:hypothetical protein|uniref:hypothetical protein n=1 Tax=Paraburkholderia sp. BCC1885 TaxID=2562669 RepID=UPI0011832252|nr:hypothetical protein [Paraburkholderia sp. BCC1885]
MITSQAGVYSTPERKFPVYVAMPIMSRKYAEAVQVKDWLQAHVEITGHLKIKRTELRHAVWRDLAITKQGVDRGLRVLCESGLTRIVDEGNGTFVVELDPRFFGP